MQGKASLAGGRVALRVGECCYSDDAFEDIVMLAEPPSGRQTSTRFGSISTMLVTLLGLIAIRWPPPCGNIEIG